MPALILDHALDPSLLIDLLELLLPDPFGKLLALLLILLAFLKKKIAMCPFRSMLFRGHGAWQPTHFARPSCLSWLDDDLSATYRR